MARYEQCLQRRHSILQLVQGILRSLGHRPVRDHNLVPDDLQKLAGVLQKVR